MLVENNGSHSFRTAKLGFRTKGGELFGGDGRNGVYLHRDNVETCFSKRYHIEWVIKF